MNLKQSLSKQVKAKEHTVGALLIMLLMVGVTVSIMFIILPETARADVPGDYLYNKRLTIESDYIMTGLVNFPVLVVDNSGDLSACLSNGSDIGFWDSTNSTHFFHEVERWDDTNDTLYAWVNVTDISASVDTNFFMYYGDSDTTNPPEGHTPQSTWDDSFILVCHMNDTVGNQLYNSAPGNDVSTTKNTTQVQTSSGYGQLFDGTMAVEWGNVYDIGTNDVTTEGYGNSTDVTTSSGRIWDKREVSSNYNVYFTGIKTNSAYALALYCKEIEWAIGVQYADNPQSTFYNDTWYYVTAWCERSVVQDVSIDDSGPTKTGEELPMTGADIDNDAVFTMGRTAIGGSYYIGLIDEIRLSFTVRNESWINATYHTLNQTTGFITGAGIVGPSSFSVTGLTNNRITWGGQNGTDVWCNETGEGNEWMNISMSMNGSDNVSEIRIWVGDLADTGADVGASNITMYVSSDNSSYDVLEDNQHGLGNGIFPEGGDILSINASTFPSGGGTNPFDGAGITDKDASIYCIFKLSIPATQITDAYYNSSTWQVRIGRWV